jgi:hypothetical protein
MPKRVPLVMLVATIASGAEAQTITFPNVTPAATIRLEAGSTLSIDTNGNLIARCDASDPAGCARLFQSGSGGNQCGPAVTFTAPLNVTSPTNPPAPGPYPAGSQLTIGAQVSGAAVCVPSATPVSISGWNAPLIPNGNTVTQTITLPNQQSTTYTLRLTCYGSIGSATSERTVTTSAQVNPPPAACPTQFPTSTAYTSATAGATAPTQISGVTIRNINGFEELLNVLGFNVNPFPNTGTRANLVGPWNQIRVIRFEVPNPFPQGSFLRRFQFFSWPNGFIGGLDAYISVSTCPGDLRIPTSQQSGTANDPTYAEACRNWRGNSWTFEDTGQSDLPYVVGVPGQPNISTPSQCVLEPGRTYYLNIFLSKPNKNSRSLFPFQPICPGDFECGNAITAGA